MKNSIARISFAIFIVVFIATFFIPAISGGLVPIFGFLIVSSVTMVMVGTKKFKIVGIACLLVSVTLLISDYHAGKEYQAKIQKQIELIESKEKN